eukprot:TRINITY_DN56741_c0_g1_i1.p1 TRINITY_DN56741_c0_g1~~TRINITY_DN56741_c0_g1_i1.p1  ORF type:complete len:223 (+),score=36.92 TRINITY_DN56741_c0_g1_i1:94-762(+)
MSVSGERHSPDPDASTARSHGHSHSHNHSHGHGHSHGRHGCGSDTSMNEEELLSLLRSRGAVVDGGGKGTADFDSACRMGAFTLASDGVWAAVLLYICYRLIDYTGGSQVETVFQLWVWATWGVLGPLLMCTDLLARMARKSGMRAFFTVDLPLVVGICLLCGFLCLLLAASAQPLYSACFAGSLILCFALMTLRMRYKAVRRLWRLRRQRQEAAKAYASCQ